MSSAWRPAETQGFYRRSGRPVVGETVAYDYRAWEVIHVDDVDPSTEEQDRLNGYIPAVRDKYAPYRVVLRRIHGEKRDRENSRQEIALGVPVGGYSFPTYPHGRVPLCSCHGHPWPCLERDQHVAAEMEMKRAEKELRLMPGCCPACEEPVTSRQQSITFGGPNVRNPLAEGPTFHLRRKCRSAAADYENVWVADELGRPRSLLTMSCAGTVIVHADGSGECFGADGSDCPSIFARHRCMSACYIQSHGCPKECPPGRHGTRLAGYPSDPRAVTQTTTPDPTRRTK